MANVVLKETYSCFNDCRMEGCPKYEATLEFQTVSNAYTFDDGKGRDKMYFAEDEVEVLISLLKKLSERRADSVKV